MLQRIINTDFVKELNLKSLFLPVILCGVFSFFFFFCWRLPRLTW